MSHDFTGEYSKRGEAVRDGEADLELGLLTVEVPRNEALTQQFHTMHPFVGKTVAGTVF